MGSFFKTVFFFCFLFFFAFFTLNIHVAFNMHFLCKVLNYITRLCGTFFQYEAYYYQAESLKHMVTVVTLSVDVIHFSKVFKVFHE